jgi:hypothetical protein
MVGDGENSKENDKEGNEIDDASILSTAQTPGRPMCFFCYVPFCHRESLIRHCKMYIRNGVFNQPFLCPECIRQGNPNSLISASPSAWSNHVERCHGKINAPNLLSYPPAYKQSRCLVCEGLFMKGKGLQRHFKIIC